MGSSLYSPGPMFPGSYIPRVLCSPFFAIGEHRPPFIKKGPMFPFSSKRVLCSPGSMFPGFYVPRYLKMGPPYIPRALCSPGPMFPDRGT